MKYKRSGSKMEDVTYNIPDFPVYLCWGEFAPHTCYRILSHWHDDLEFLYMASGQLFYNINDQRVRLKAGEGIFVNGRQLHSTCSADGSDCTFLCLLFHPTLLCSSPWVEQKFVLPVLENQALPFGRRTSGSARCWTGWWNCPGARTARCSRWKPSA